MADQIPPTLESQEQKPKGIDELDILGGLLLKFLKAFVAFYRQLFNSNK